MVYKEGNDASGSCDPVPSWLTRECVYKDFCQCNVVGPHHHDWHHLGALYNNVVNRRHQLFESRCGCSQIESEFHSGCIKNTKNLEIAIRLSRTMIHVLTDVPPSVPQRGEPLVSVLTSRKRKPKWERARLRGLRKRLIQRLKRRNVMIREERFGGDDD